MRNLHSSGRGPLPVAVLTSRVVELFGRATAVGEAEPWAKLVQSQPCPYLKRKCLKVRKSEPEISIGTCTVANGQDRTPIVICPHRFRERGQVFTDCLHLLTLHQPGNELHVVPEVTIPGGSVDYFLVSARDGKLKDFIGIEFQTLDTTGTVWPERQRFLASMGIEVKEEDTASEKGFGMNWKMTARTILVQLHHKIETFEQLNKHFVLVVQDHRLAYLALGLQVSANLEMEVIVQALESKLSDQTRFTVEGGAPSAPRLAHESGGPEYG